MVAVLPSWCRYAAIVLVVLYCHSIVVVHRDFVSNFGWKALL